MKIELCDTSAASKAKWRNFELLAESLFWHPIYDHWFKVSLGTSSSKLGSEQLKTKTVQAALARMSNMFMGTLTIKGPKTSTAIGMSLEEMDRPVHCPENIDRASWNTMCKLRRDKISMEEALRALAKEVAEAEIIVDQRRETNTAVEAKISDLKRHQEEFLQTKSELINNRQVQLMMKRGQVEVELDIMEPESRECLIITDSVIDKLNDDIVRLGEAKIQAMQESKEYRKGSLHLRWEHERLSMQKEDLEEKWREIQQTKLSKENQRSLVDSSQSSTSQEFSALDKANKQRETFHARKMEELDIIITSYEEMIEAKRNENEALLAEVTELEREVEEENRELVERTKEVEEAQAKTRLTRVMKRNKLADQIKEQQELLISLQEQVDAFVLRTFPTLG